MVSATAARATPATIPEILSQRVALTPDAEAYRQFDPLTSMWSSLTWRQFARQVLEWRDALRVENLPSGARIAVLVPNGLEHLCMDQAALFLGFVPVPLHMIDQPESLAYVLADSGAALLLIDSATHWQALEPLAGELPGLKRVVYLSGVKSSSMALTRSLDQWLDAGRSSTSTPAKDPPGPTPDGLAAIVYTSGTTGRPKGVMLTHRNVVSNVYAVLTAIRVYETDVFLSFLPLSHTLERTAGYYLPMAAGATVAFARSVQALTSDLLTVRPTVLISVPRIYERAYAAIRDSLAHRPLSRVSFAYAVKLGSQRFERVSRTIDDTAGRIAGGSEPAVLEHGHAILDRTVWTLLDRWVAAKIRKRFGGRLRVAVTAGAPIPQSVARAFLALGVPLLQGYGLTECSPVVACNRPDDNRPESVGRPLPGLQVKIGDHDELLVRGPSVMLGYWQRSEDTARVLEPDGWLHTGDQAGIDAGRLYIRGRIKDIIVTSTGEKIGPADLESAILTDPMFEQVMVLDEARSYLAALAVLNREQWAREAKKLGLSSEDPESLRSRVALDRVLERIRRAVRNFPAYATPRAVSLSLDPWTIDAGLLTPTLKPKRPALEQRFAAEIASLYRLHAL